jgi:hypothetical protein
MEEVKYRNVFMDRTDLRSALEDIARRLNEVRDTMIEDRGHYAELVDFASNLEGIAVIARKALALTATARAVYKPPPKRTPI